MNTGITNFESSTHFSLGQKILHFVSISLAILGAGLVFNLALASVPYFVALHVGQKYNLFNKYFFVIGGILTGVALSCVLAMSKGLGINQTFSDPSFFQKELRLAPVCGLCGMAAGFVAMIWIAENAIGSKTQRLIKIIRWVVLIALLLLFMPEIVGLIHFIVSFIGEVTGWYHLDFRVTKM